jgi:hypothetical protein
MSVNSNVSATVIDCLVIKTESLFQISLLSKSIINHVFTRINYVSNVYPLAINIFKA